MSAYTRRILHSFTQAFACAVARSRGDAVCRFASKESVWTGHPRQQFFLLAQNRLVREALTKVLDPKSGVSVVGSQALLPQTAEDVIGSAPDGLVVDSYPCLSSGRRRARWTLARVQQS